MTFFLPESDQPDTRQAPPERILWFSVLIQGLADHRSAIRRRDFASLDYVWPTTPDFRLVCDLADREPVWITLDERGRIPESAKWQLDELGRKAGSSPAARSEVVRRHYHANKGRIAEVQRAYREKRKRQKATP